LAEPLLQLYRRREACSAGRLARRAGLRRNPCRTGTRPSEYHARAWAEHQEGAQESTSVKSPVSAWTDGADAGSTGVEEQPASQCLRKVAPVSSSNWRI